MYSATELRCWAKRLRAAADKILLRNNQRGERINRHRVYMRYEQMMGSWRVSFTNHDSRSRFRDLTFADAEKIRDLARRAGALSDLANKQALDLGIRSRQGGLVLELTGDQFRALRG